MKKVVDKNYPFKYNKQVISRSSAYKISKAALVLKELLVVCEDGALVKRLRHRPFTAVTGVRFP